MPGSDNGGMAKEGRKEFILRVLEEVGIPLPTTVVFRACKLNGATFERRTVDRLLKELGEEGYVMKIDRDALDEGRIEEVGIEATGYWYITDRGRGRVLSG